MAKPIRAIPTLKGDDAKRFLNILLKEEKNPSKKRVEFIKKSLKMTFEVRN